MIGARGSYSGFRNLNDFSLLVLVLVAGSDETVVVFVVATVVGPLVVVLSLNRALFWRLGSVPFMMAVCRIRFLLCCVGGGIDDDNGDDDDCCTVLLVVVVRVLIDCCVFLLLWLSLCCCRFHMGTKVLVFS